MMLVLFLSNEFLPLGRDTGLGAAKAGAVHLVFAFLWWLWVCGGPHNASSFRGVVVFETGVAATHPGGMGIVTGILGGQCLERPLTLFGYQTTTPFGVGRRGVKKAKAGWLVMLLMMSRKVVTHSSQGIVGGGASTIVVVVMVASG